MIPWCLSSFFADLHKQQRACTRIVTGGILFLILFTPLAFGAVHSWAFSLLEVVIFLLVMVWVGRLCLETPEQEAVRKGERGADRALGRLLLPLVLFLSLVLL